MKEIVGKHYINTEQNTLDCVLLFIPNEAIYHFLHDCGPTNNVFDEAMRNKVILCSPINLFAILAVIRQASEHYRLEKSTKQILNILKDFRKQWNDYVNKMEDVGKHFEKAQQAFQELLNKRKTNLDKQLDKIDALSVDEEDASSAEMKLLEATI
jgi:DNA recombination protein RmuC